MRAQVCRIKKLYSSFHVREAPPEKRVLFGTIDPNVGGWGRMDPSIALYYISLLIGFGKYSIGW